MSPHFCSLLLLHLYGLSPLVYLRNIWKGLWLLVASGCETNNYLTRHKTGIHLQISGLYGYTPGKLASVHRCSCDNNFHNHICSIWALHSLLTVILVLPVEIFLNLLLLQSLTSAQIFVHFCVYYSTFCFYFSFNFLWYVASISF